MAHPVFDASCTAPGAQAGPAELEGAPSGVAAGKDSTPGMEAVLEAVEQCEALSSEVRALLGHCLCGPAALAEPRLRSMSQVLLAELQTPFPARRAAQLAGLERQYFSTFFRICMGVNFARWRRLVRVACAVYFLRVWRTGIDEAARRVGYRTASELGRAMRKETSWSPRRLARTGMADDASLALSAVEPVTAAERQR